jgi:hypothetical protein
VGSRQLVHVVGFTVGGFTAVEPRTIPGRHTPFHIADGIARSGNMAGYRSRSATVKEKRWQEKDEN